ncbi:hypothetical protein HK104_005397, partial [Borealophlyctis nickersoniae]
MGLPGANKLLVDYVSLMVGNGKTLDAIADELTDVMENADAARELATWLINYKPDAAPEEEGDQPNGNDENASASRRPSTIGDPDDDEEMSIQLGIEDMEPSDADFSKEEEFMPPNLEANGASRMLGLALRGAAAAAGKKRAHSEESKGVGWGEPAPAAGRNNGWAEEKPVNGTIGWGDEDGPAKKAKVWGASPHDEPEVKFTVTIDAKEIKNNGKESKGGHFDHPLLDRPLGVSGP